MEETNDAPILVVKLSSGQELVGKLLHEDETQLVLQSPLVIQMVKTEHNQIGMTLLPFSFAGNQEQVSISKFHVICMMAPDSQFATQYSANLAGITLADSSNMPKITL